MGAYPSTASPRLICEGWIDLICFTIVGIKTQKAYIVLDEQDFTVFEESDMKSPKYKWPSGKIETKFLLLLIEIF